MNMLTESSSPGVEVKQVRHKDFARRMELACDGNPSIPPLNYGRLVWFVDRLAEHDVKISTEGVRKWFAGETRPLHKVVVVLAQILAVDVQWLESGNAPEFDARQRRQFRASGDGAVNVVAGVIQMDGGTVAFPDDDDEDALKELISFYAIIRGAKYSFHIVASIDPEKGRFIVPNEARGTIVLGLLPVGKFAFRIFEFDWEHIDSLGKKKPNGIEIVIGDHTWREIDTFSQRI